MPPAPSRRSTRYRPASNSPTRSPAKLGTTSSTAPSRFKPTVPSCFDQCKFLLHHVPADPHDLGTAHDGVHGVWRAHERLFVGSRDLGAREVIPAALSRTNHASSVLDIAQVITESSCCSCQRA